MVSLPSGEGLVGSFASLLRIGGNVRVQHLVTEQHGDSTEETVVSFVFGLVDGDLLGLHITVFVTKDEVLHGDVGNHVIVTFRVDEDHLVLRISLGDRGFLGHVAVEEIFELGISRGGLLLEGRNGNGVVQTILGSRIIFLLRSFGSFARIGDSFVLFNPSVDGVVVSLHTVVHIGHIVSGSFLGQFVTAVFSSVSSSLIGLQFSIPSIHVRELRNILEGLFVFGDVTLGTLNGAAVEVNEVLIGVRFAVPSIVRIVLANLFGTFGIGESLLGFHHLDLLILDFFPDGEVSLGSTKDSFLLGSGQVLSLEGDVAEDNAESLFSLGFFSLLVDQVDLVLLVGELHLFLDGVDLSFDLSSAEFILHRLLGDFEFFQFTLQSLHLRVGIRNSLLMSSFSLLQSGLSLLQGSLSLAEDTVLATQLRECVVVPSLGFAEGLDAFRLNLLDTGSEKTAGSNHNHQ